MEKLFGYPYCHYFRYALAVHYTTRQHYDFYFSGHYLPFLCVLTFVNARVASLSRDVAEVSVNSASDSFPPFIKE